MSSKQTNIERQARSLGVSPAELREKERLVRLIVGTRKERGLSQAELAEKIGVSQGRVAQIESGVGAVRITFDVLLNVLFMLGYDFKIQARKTKAKDEEYSRTRKE